MLALDSAFWVICLVLVAAGATKLAEPAHLASALRQLGLLGADAGHTARAADRSPGARAASTGEHAARAVGAVEVVLGVAGLAVGGRWIAAAVAAVYLAFTVVVVLARRRGLASCGCFGSHSGAPSSVHAALNALSATVAAVAVATAPPAVADALEGRGPAGVALVVVVLLAACAVVVVDTRGGGTTVPAGTSSRGTDGRP